LKENLLKNSSIGILKIISASIIMLILTSLLVNSLGKTTYGIIALFTSLNQYIGLFILAISGTIFKFVSIEYNKDNNLIETNKYYSTSFFSLIFIISLLFLTTIMLSPYIGDILNIDSYNEIKKDFFILSILSFLLQSVVSVFIVSSMIKHKFYLNDFANIFSKIIQFIFILVLLYLIDDLNLITYGYSLVLFSILYLFLSFLISKRTIPELEITFKFFSFNHLKDILSMGLKVILNNLGILLYTSTDILIISIFLGTAYVTDYSLSLQLALFIALIGSVVSRLFDPEISSQIAKRKFKEIELTPKYLEVIKKVQHDIEIVSEPFKNIVDELNLSYDEFFSILEELKEAGVMRRFASILNHRKAGFNANAMVVWDIDEKQGEKIGKNAAEFSAVSHCYLRPKYPNWPFNLFTMIHGKTKEETDGKIAEIANEISHRSKMHLYSSREFKKVRIVYFIDSFTEWENSIKV